MTTNPPGSTGLGPRPTHHWKGISVVVIVSVGIGLLTGHPGILLAGITGIGYLAYAQALPLGTVRVSVDRDVSSSDPDPGDEIDVTVTVSNEGDSLPDVRVIDGVPADLEVATGSPRVGTSLLPGQSVSFSYSIAARRGSHEFGPIHVIAKNLPNTTERDQYVEADTTITCVPRPVSASVHVPLRAQTTHVTGQIGADQGGEGVEFFGTRNYRSGDDHHRIDWRRLARTGDIATIEFQQERIAKVVIAIDTHPSAYIAPGAGVDHAVDRSVDGAIRVFNRLLADGHLVGLASFGRAEGWLAPGTGVHHRDEGHRLLGVDPAFSPHPPSEEVSEAWSFDRFRRRVPPDGQVLVFSPVYSGRMTNRIQRLEANGIPVTVISPDPTSDRTPSQRLAQLFRTFQLSDLRTTGIPVVDWSDGESIDFALVRGLELMRE